MAEKNTTQQLIAFSILFILGAVLIAVIADQTNINTQKTRVYSEDHDVSSCLIPNVAGGWNISSSDCEVTLTNAPTGWEQEDSDCYVSGVVVYNGTGSALTLTTDYTISETDGVITILDSANTINLSGNDTSYDYQYCADGYVAESWGRSILNVNVGLFAVVLLIAVAALVYIMFGKDYF